MNIRKFKLQLFFIIFFLADKLLLIPSVRYSITEALPGNPYQETILPEEKNRTKDTRPVWVFGTSRSFPLYKLPVAKNTAADPYLSPLEKKELSGFEFYPFAYPASNPSLYFVQIMQLLERGEKPDMIVLELAPFAFNRNIRFVNSSKIEGIPLQFALSHHTAFPGQYISDIVTSRLFAVTRYKITIQSIKNNLLNIHDQDENPLMRQFRESNTKDLFSSIILEYNESFKTDKLYTEADFHDYEANEPFKNETEKFLKIDLPVKSLKSDFYSNFAMNGDMFLFLDSIIKETARRNIPLVFWIPRDHEEFQKSLTDIPQIGEWNSIILDITAKNNISLIDMRKPGSLKCNSYQDVIHLSGRCYSEIAYKLVKNSILK